ncbi:MAG: hypothetical protein ACYCX3_07470 [Thermoleophilia bacterium]
MRREAPGGGAEGLSAATAVAWILRAGVGLAGALLVSGLVLQVQVAQEVGILVLLAAPATALGAAFVLYVKQKDWLVAGACLLVMLVLGATVFAAA